MRSSGSLRLEDYDYELPAELIAQEPTEARDASRLLVLHRDSGRIEHRRFHDIVALLREGDLLVLNDTKVFPARLRGLRPSGRPIEILLLEPNPRDRSWSALVRPARVARAGCQLGLLDEPAVTVHPLRREEDRVVLELRRAGEVLDPDAVTSLCDRLGEVPLPPYILRTPEDRRDTADRERYQTVYARSTGAVAAPTAGLHFTQGLIDEIARKGVSVACLTLHVGYGTFKPLSEDRLARSTLHEEWVEIGLETAEAILETRREGRRIVAVGTTSVRAIESFLGSGTVPFRRKTDLFIKPGYRFLGVGGLVTNFHLPRSSLLILVSALAGRQPTLAAYSEAVREGYRFYSYGDAMLIL